MTADDSIESGSDRRIELTAVGNPVMALHRSEAQLTRGLADLVEIDGSATAVRGSSGSNTGDHKAPKVAQALVPMPTNCRVMTGNDLVTVNGVPVATDQSNCQVPDVMKPVKGGVLRVEQQLVVVDGERIARGSA